jgi:ribosomal protein L37AE/L43A
MKHDIMDNMKEICTNDNRSVFDGKKLSNLSYEYEEYDNSVLKQSEKELLLILDISSETSYHCSECGTQVYPNFPTPIAYCDKCNAQNTWRKNSHWEENMTFEQLTQFTFNKAKEFIFKMSLKKRISMLKELDYKLVYLYQATKEYNDQMFGKSMPPKDFMSIMGKIKHLEILQNWLYGIE